LKRPIVFQLYGLHARQLTDHLTNTYILPNQHPDKCNINLKKNEHREKIYLSWSNSHETENISQKKGAEDLSIAVMDAWPEELHPSPLKLDIRSQLTRGSPMWTKIGNICSLTNKFDLDPPSLDISRFNSLISTVDFGVCNVQ